MNRAYKWLLPWQERGECRWNGNDKRWTFASGATLTFGYLEGATDHYQYQGAEFQGIFFDELSQFEEFQFKYLFSRLRRKKGVNIPLRVRAASNPGGIGHEWVKQRYIVEGRSKNRPFIPAKLTDNPYIDQDEYILSLAELDYVTRKQLLEGDWDASYDGGLFKRQWFEVVDRPSENTLLGAQYQRHWDLAASEPSADYPDPDYTTGCLLAESRSGIIYVLDMQHDRLTAGGVEELVKQTAAIDGRHIPISIEEEGGAAGKSLIHHYMTTVLPGYAVEGHRPSGDKFTRAKPLSSQFEHGNIKIVRGPWNSDFINEMVWFPKGGHDDQVDAISGAYEGIVAGEGLSMRQAHVKGRPQ